MSTTTERTPHQVKQDLIAAVAMYGGRMPIGWQSWSTEQLLRFRADVLLWRKVAVRAELGTRVSLHSLQEAAAALLAHYGKTLDEVAP